MKLKEKFNEEKLLELLEDKINEAENEEDLEYTEEFLKGYKNGIEMAKDIIKEHEYLYEIDGRKRYTLKDYESIHNYMATKEYLKALKNEDFDYILSLISGCEFDIEINPNGTLDLRDLQGVYLGGKESYEGFENVFDLCNRLQYSYFYDYFGIEVY